VTFGATRVVGRQPCAPAAFTPGEISGTHFQLLSRTQGTRFRRGEPRKKSPVTPPGIDPEIVRLVAQCLNHKIQLYIFFNLGARRGWMFNATSRPPYPRKRDLTPIVQEAGWVPGGFWTGTEYLAPTEIRSPDPSARSEWLYQLRCPGPLTAKYLGKHATFFSVLFLYKMWNTNVPVVRKCCLSLVWLP
jgi:hypothetical protein